MGSRWIPAGLSAFLLLAAFLWVWTARLPERVPKDVSARTAEPNPSETRLSPPGASQSELTSASEESVARFVDVAQTRGVRFIYNRGESGDYLPVEPVGGGAGWLDYDGDGYLDLVLVNGASLPVDASQRFVATRLYRSVEGRQFFETTEHAGLFCHDYGQGCAVADYDNDGDGDLYVTNYGRCALLQNNNDGTFSERTDVAGVPGGQWNTGACFADFNRDGILDLYVANYFDFTPTGYEPCRSPEGNPMYCGPADSPSLPDNLYQGVGDGTFENVSQVLGDHRGPAFGGVAADLDNDGWPDLYVANDARPNHLFHNQGSQIPSETIRFSEQGFEWGAAVNADGVGQASMGVCCADVDRNGLLDLAISHFIFEYLTVYQNRASRDFYDASQQLGVGAKTFTTMGWGVAFLDYDNNGWLDLFVANGHLNRTTNQAYEMAPQLFQNLHGSRFAEVGPRSGPYFKDAWIGRGSATADFDNDGRVDLAVVHHHRPAALLHNETDSENRSITLELIGRRSCRDALNARVVLWLDDPEETEPVRIMHELVSGDSYLSSNDRRVQLGIGNGRVMRGQVHWPSGGLTEFGALEGSANWLAVEAGGAVPGRMIRR